MTPQDLAAAFRSVFEHAKSLDAPLNTRLELVAAFGRAHPSSFTIAIENLIGRLRRGEAGAGAPKVGDAMPPFLLPDDQGRLVSLEQILAHGPAAIVFHRGHWCPYCRLSLAALAQTQAKALALGGQIVAITPERQAFARKHKAEAGAEFALLTDMDNEYSMSLGLGFYIGEEMIKLYQASGTDFTQFHGNGSWTLPIPATFVVDRSGTIRARRVDPDWRQRMEIDDLLAALRAAQ
jgi:peroxiredoxin